MPASPHTRAAALDVWLQGMSSDPGASDSDWKETLYFRLEMDYVTLGSGDTTLDSECKLGLPAQTYFSINCRYPGYDGQVVAFKASDGISSSARVAPFDTGGVVQSKTPFISASPDSLSDRVKVVELHTLEVSDARGQFSPWVNQAYERRGLYENNARPSGTPFVDEIDITATSDARAWSWEARLKIEPNVGNGALQPAKVYLTPSEYADYVTWVEKEHGPQSVKHLDFVAAIYKEDENPVEMMASDLEGGVLQ